MLRTKHSCAGVEAAKRKGLVIGAATMRNSNSNEYVLLMPALLKRSAH